MADYERDYVEGQGFPFLGGVVLIAMASLIAVGALTAPVELLARSVPLILAVVIAGIGVKYCLDALEADRD